MKKIFDEQWHVLQQVKSTATQKTAVRERILHSIQQPAERRTKHAYLWQSGFAFCLLLLIFGGFMFYLLQDTTKEQSSNAKIPTGELFTWNLANVSSKKEGEAFILYRKQEQVGLVRKVSKQQMDETIATKPMFVNQELQNFPYQTFMYIEHVKMEKVSVRYYFYILIDKNEFLEFTFDYPKLEYADIFRAMSTLEINGKKAYHHDKPLYVTHGYGTMIFPVDLKPVSISTFTKEYKWESASFGAYQQYVKKIQNGVWKQQASSGAKHTFISYDGNEVVTITLKGKTLTYTFSYPNQDQQ
ncbi:hypothetical protein [Bacillus rubiinfantis]|uniref:hypothetical protein n=1 Tax=Bacillus rubiinfantis TaxID=1499680 RepID=UPI0005A64776|nr:hypothetical protein [Bacillus rubiinfantis]